MKSMQNAEIYAQALFELGREQKKEEKLLQEFQAILSLQEQEPQIKEFLELPLATEERKQRMLENLGGDISPLFLDFIRVLIHKGHFYLFPKIYVSYRNLVDHEANRTRVTAITAVPLSEEESLQISEILGPYLKKKVLVKNEINPDILGGIVLEMEDWEIDASLRGRLEKLGHHLKKAQERLPGIDFV